MIIIKQGDKKQRVFTCTNCGCEFIAERNEYFRVGKFHYYKCDCPCCTYTTDISKPVEDADDDEYI